MNYYFDNFVKPCLMDRYKVKVDPDLPILSDGNTLARYDFNQLVDVSGTDVISWGDITGNNNNLSVVGAPQLTASGIVFDGISDYCFHARADIAQPFTLYVVFSQQISALNGIILGSNNNFQAHIQQRGGNAIRAWAGLTGLGGQTVDTNKMTIASAVFNGIASRSIIDGNITSGDVGPRPLSGGWRIGFGNSAYAPITVKSAIIRTIQDTTENQYDIYNFLIDKYSLSIPKI